MPNEVNIVAVYRFPQYTVRIADNAYRDLTPEQIERNKENARTIACQIIERAAAAGIKV